MRVLTTTIMPVVGSQDLTTVVRTTVWHLINSARMSICDGLIAEARLSFGRSVVRRGLQTSSGHLQQIATSVDLKTKLLSNLAQSYQASLEFECRGSSKFSHGLHQFLNETTTLTMLFRAGEKKLKKFSWAPIKWCRFFTKCDLFSRNNVPSKW